MLNLTDAERALVIADIESSIEWQIPKGFYTNCKSEIDICKSLLLDIRWDILPGKDEQEELEKMLEDFLDEDYAELYSVRETEMRKTILAKVRGWRGDKHGDKLPKDELF